MTRRTKKVGSAGRYGTRYGVKVRYRVKAIDADLAARNTCPRCQHNSVTRKKSGIWTCSRCSYTYAAAAYTPKLRSKVEEGA
ncbi:MAG: 50S ribosomal protein L37ae [Candidatus Thermoplasmatota archaeon]|nr:50S ribosomal protein L37ae [Candidatus Thermoplasmatota archaeon]